MGGLLLGARARGAWVLSLALAGCATDCGGDGPAAALPAEPAPEEVVAPTWPDAVIPDLPPATPATRVELRRDGARVDNHALVGTWPASALDRSRAQAPRGETDWPRLRVELDALEAQTGAFPALTSALRRAREAERSATGAGSGAGVFNLAVGSDVPWGDVAATLSSAALAGYGPPRLLLRAGSAERMMSWPRRPPPDPEREAELAALVEQLDRRLGARAGSEPAPTDEEPSDQGAPTEGALEPEPVPEGPAPARVVLTPEAVRVRLGAELQAAGCAGPSSDDGPEALTLLPDAPPDAVGRCLDALQPRADSTLTLYVDPAVPFGRVVVFLQHARRAFPHAAVYDTGGLVD